MAFGKKPVKLFMHLWFTYEGTLPGKYDFFKRLVWDVLKEQAPSIKLCLSRFENHPSYQSKEYQALVDLLSRQDRPLSAYWISTFYALSLGEKKRRDLGAYFTPPDLSSLLVEEVLRILDKDPFQCSFADICCGGGALLVPLAKVLIQKMEELKFGSEEIVETTQNCLVGQEMDPFLLQLTRVYLIAELDEHIRTSSMWPELSLYLGDALRHTPFVDKFDVIVGNPPYKALTKNEDRELRSYFGHIMKWNSNFYPLFLDKSLSLLKPDGILSAIVPTSLYTSKNFVRVRKRISKAGTVASIFWLTNRKGVFHDVLQEISVITIDCSLSSKKSETLIRSLGKGFDSNFKTRIPCRQGEKTWPIPKTEEQANLLGSIKNVPFRIKDYGYSVHIGHLVWNRDRRQRFVSFPKYGRRRGVFPIIWPFQIDPEKGLVLYPHRCGKKEYFIQMGGDRRGVVTNKSLVLKRTTSSGSSKLLSCSPVPDKIMEHYGGFVAENHVIVLQKNSCTQAVDPHVLASVLNSSPVNLVYQCFSGTVSVSRHALESLPLPDPGIVQSCVGVGNDIEKSVLVGYGVG